MRKYAIVLSVAVVELAIALSGTSVRADTIKQRIVPMECVIDYGQPTQSYLSEAMCDELMNPTPPDDNEPIPGDNNEGDGSPSNPPVIRNEEPSTGGLVVDDGLLLLSPVTHVAIEQSPAKYIVDHTSQSSSAMRNFWQHPVTLATVGVVTMAGVLVGALLRFYWPRFLQK